MEFLLVNFPLIYIAVHEEERCTSPNGYLWSLQSVYKPKPAVRGFTIGQSIISNASTHVKRKYVFNIDIENFFGAINFGRVRGLFMGLFLRICG
jgi:hypothetical protein